MKQKIFAIRDITANYFNKPFTDHNEGAAMRGFDQAVNDSDPNNMINKYPAHFELYLCGEFDTETGALIPLERPKALGTGESFKR